MKDQMSPLERMTAYNTGRSIDRLPCVPIVGNTVTLHICGKTSKIWSLMADAGADCISIDNDADLLEAKLKVG